MPSFHTFAVFSGTKAYFTILFAGTEAGEFERCLLGNPSSESHHGLHMLMAVHYSFLQIYHLQRCFSGPFGWTVPVLFSLLKR